MCMIFDFAFAAPSPSAYISRPQPTEQYGQVLRVSRAWASLNWRTCASTGAGANPSAARLVAPIEEAETFRNSRRETLMGVPPISGRYSLRPCSGAAPRRGHLGYLDQGA